MEIFSTAMQNVTRPTYIVWWPKNNMVHNDNLHYWHNPTEQYSVFLTHNTTRHGCKNKTKALNAKENKITQPDVDEIKQHKLFRYGAYKTKVLGLFKKK